MISKRETGKASVSLLSMLRESYTVTVSMC